MPRSRPISVAAGLAALAACSTVPRATTSAAGAGSAASVSAPSAGERGAFVSRLGNDTVAVEQYVRYPDRIEGDAVTRTPATAVRHYVATLGPAGTVTRLVYDARRANGSAPPTHAELTFGAESTTMHVQAGGRDTTVQVAARQALPWVNLSWSLAEQILRRARAIGAAAGDSTVVPVLGVGTPQAQPAVVRLLGADSTLVDLGEGAPFRARVDADGRILGLQGDATALKVRVDRVPGLDAASFARDWTARDSAGRGLGTLSPLDSASARVGPGTVNVVYSRPSLRGRQLAGFLIPYDQVWRTGANAATMFTTSRDLVLSGTAIPAGKYTLWSQLGHDGWMLIVNRETGQWGTDYHADRDFARIPMTVTHLTTPVERFTIAVDPTPAGGTLRLLWGDMQGSVPFTVR